MIEISKNPWILIILIFFELLLIIIPALIASKIEKLTFKEELIEMGFKKNEDRLKILSLKITAGLEFGFIFYLTAGYLIFVFKYLIIENIFGSTFVKEAEKGTINTTPLQPNLAQLIIIIILQLIIVGPCEEGFFRGFILKRCENKVKSIYAILISSFFFAIYHTPPLLVSLATIITYFSYYFVFGLLLALIFKFFKNSLIPCSIAHSFFNILIILF